ncbi:MAG: peptidylprolyl isomerase [Bacteroidota bacterium]
MDSVRTKVIANNMSFNEAASKYSDDDAAKYSGAFIMNRDGSSYVTIDQLDKEMVAMISKMKIGDISQPIAFTGDQGKKGARIVFLKSRSEPHRMNMQDDYSKISQAALEEKKSVALDKWIKARIPTYYIMVDNLSAADCPTLQKFNMTTDKGF